MRLIWRAIRTVCFLVMLTFLSIIIWSTLWPVEQIPTRKADAIICLSAGALPDGRPDIESSQRARSCNTVYQAGVAPVVVFTGGVVPGQNRSVAQAMADLAISEGLPPDAVIIEPEAESTLQNALFSFPLIPDAKRLVLVTSAYHLPRSWLSFAFFGQFDNSLVAASNLPMNIQKQQPYMWRMVRETLAYGLNVIRAPAYGLAGLLGVPAEDRVDWLH